MIVRSKLALAALMALLAGLYAGRSAPVSVRVTSTPAAAVPAAAGDAVAVNGSRPLRPPSELTLRGEVLGLPAGMSLSEIKATISGRSYVGSASGMNYTVYLPDWSASDMVVIDVQTTTGLRLRSLAGSARRLAARGGFDAHATAAEAPGLRVNTWTTATAAVLQARLGREPLSDTEMEEALTRVRMADIGAIAYLLDGYATGNRTLPAGFSTGYDVATTQSTLRTALRSISNDWNYWNTATFDFAKALPILAPLADATELPESLLARTELPDDLPQSVATYLLSRRSDGKHDFFGSALSQTPYSASISSGVLRLVPDAATRYRLRETRPFSPSLPVDIERTLDSVEWRRMHDGESVDTWIVVWKWVERYPFNPQQAPQVVTTGTGLASGDLPAAVNRGAWASITGQRRTFPTTCFRAVAGMPMLQVCDTAIHRFDAGGTGITEDVGLKVDAYMRPVPGTYGSSFSWRTQGDGSLVIESAGARTVAWATQSRDGVDSLIYYTWKTSSDATQSMAGTTLSVVAETVPYGAAQAQGTWGAGLIVSTAFEYPSTDYRFEFLRNSDGTGARVSTYPHDDQVFSSRQKWSIQGERIWEYQIRAMYGSNGMPQTPPYDCDAAFAAGATTCSPIYYRYFRPLRRVGQRLYGIEEIHTQGSSEPRGYTGTYDVQSTTRANFQLCVSGSCLAYGAQASATLESSLSAAISRAVPPSPDLSHAHLRLRMRRLRP